MLGTNNTDHTMSAALYSYIDETDHIPDWVVKLYPQTHWCGEFDDLLVTDGMTMELSICKCFENE